ncbi:hypothetical protein BH11VER1_BH11VER1_01050 [soil metagenome]
MKSNLLIPLFALFLTACSKEAKSYPLQTCVISGEKLGSMGAPVKVSHDGTEVQLCCKNCIEDFNKDPAKYAKMVKDATLKK